MDIVPSQYSVLRMIKDIENPNLNQKIKLDFSLQRSDEQWDAEWKSKLIHSMLQDIDIPSIYIVKDGTEKYAPMSLIDGKQRVTVTCQYVKDGFRLHKNTPDIKFYNPKTGEIEQTLKIAGRKYSELPEDFQNTILYYEFSTKLLMNCTDWEIELQLERLNAQKNMNTTQKALIQGGKSLGDQVQIILKNDFFKERISYSKRQKKNSEGVKCVLISLIINSGMEYTQLNNKNFIKTSAALKEKWQQEQIDYLNALFQQLDEMLPEQDNELDKVLTTANIPVFLMNLEKFNVMSEDGNITEEQYKDFLKYWIKSGIKKEEYTQHYGKSIFARANIEGRIEVMEKELIEFIENKKSNSSEQAA